MKDKLSNARRHLLLVQVRREGDPLLVHEYDCIRKRLADCPVDVHVRNVVAGDIEPEILRGFDYLVVGGSGDFSVHHPGSLHWVSQLRQLYDAALSLALPSFGICFGHQVLGMHFGAEVRTGPEGAEAGTIEVHLNAQGKADTVFGSLGLGFGAHTGHSDYVTETPSGLTLLASSDHLETQVFRVQGAPFYSSQFHPDLTAGEAQYRYALFSGVADDKERPSENSASLFDASKDSIASLLSRFVEMHPPESR